jgi:hypothetical protein
MSASPEGSRILNASTLAHLASGLFEGKLSRLYDEPSEMSDVAHESLLQSLLSNHAGEALGMLENTPIQAASEMAFEFATGPEGLNDLIQRLRQQGLEEYSRAFRQSRLGENRERAVDWFSRQPAIVEAVLSLREKHPDGSFTMHWPSLYGILSRSIAVSNVEWLKELFEDCGYHYFNRDIEDLGNWHLPSSAGAS